MAGGKGGVVKKPKTCLGYGPTEGRCLKPAGCPHSLYWCVDCNRLRMDAISASLEKILAGMERRAAAGQEKE